MARFTFDAAGNTVSDGGSPTATGVTPNNSFDMFVINNTGTSVWIQATGVDGRTDPDGTGSNPLSHTDIAFDHVATYARDGAKYARVETGNMIKVDHGLNVIRWTNTHVPATSSAGTEYPTANSRNSAITFAVDKVHLTGAVDGRSVYLAIEGDLANVNL